MEAFEKKTMSYEDAYDAIAKGSVGFNVYISVGQVAPLIGDQKQQASITANVKVTREQGMAFLEAAYAPYKGECLVNMYYTEESIFIGEEAYLL